MKVLVINAGSSSLKFRLFEMPGEAELCAGSVERIGAEEGHIKYTIGGGGAAGSEGSGASGSEGVMAETREDKAVISDHGEAVRKLLSILPAGEIGLVGHRVVHGGPDVSAAVLATEEIKSLIRDLFEVSPLHNPIDYKCLEVAQELLPAAKQVVVFDTAWHTSLPPVAYRYAIPPFDPVRAYGFHGTSHKYVTERAAEFLGRTDLKMISIHLGNGCSMAAVSGGRSVDTSMGFSPLTGLVMGTRSGDIDVSAVLHMMTSAGMSAEDVSKLLNKESGLQGLCGAGDMRDVRKAATGGSKDALFALELYVYRIKKYIGAYTAVLGGLDALIFTAGVGEHDAWIREEVCRGMSFFGITSDRSLNQAAEKGIFAINEKDARVKVLVVPTNEELEIARQGYALVG